jgi:hypothetical protein
MPHIKRFILPRTALPDLIVYAPTPASALKLAKKAGFTVSGGPYEEPLNTSNEGIVESWPASGSPKAKPAKVQPAFVPLVESILKSITHVNGVNGSSKVSVK